MYLIRLWWQNALIISYCVAVVSYLKVDLSDLTRFIPWAIVGGMSPLTPTLTPPHKFREFRGQHSECIDVVNVAISFQDDRHSYNGRIYVVQ